MKHDNHMLPYEVQQSAELGNRVAVEIMRKTKPSINAALRHMIDKSGLHDAKLMAVKVLGLSYGDAGELCRRLQASKGNDIVSPHWSL